MRAEDTCIRHAARSLDTFRGRSAAPSAARQSRDRSRFGAGNDPGPAAHHQDGVPRPGKVRRLRIMNARQTALAAALLALTATPLSAQPSEAGFDGETITIYVGYTAGGSYDLYGRLISRHLGQHLAGRPAVVVQNMPGAGSL